MEPVPDGELIEAWRGGDEAAATELVRRHAGPLARFLSASGVKPEDLEDLVQDTFFKAFRKIQSFRGGSAFRTWLLAIGGNTMRDAWRRSKKRQVLPIEGWDAVDEGADPHGETTVRDLEERMTVCVKQLPDMQRNVFLMRAQQGFSYEEIAVALGTSGGAARVHYHHAVKRLKGLLD